MVEPSTVEDVPPPVLEDHKDEEIDSTPQQHTNGETPSDLPVEDTNPEPEANGTAHDAPAKENGAAAQAPAPAEDTVTGPEPAADSDAKSKTDKAEDMNKKPTTSPVKRFVKTSNPAKPGSTVAAKAGSVGASVKKVALLF
jgi:hypothetical protein